MTLTTQPDCQSCLHSMQGHDLKRICRQFGYLCSPEAAEGCKRFIYEPGTDAAEQPWYSGGWCVTTSQEGRGD